MPRGGTRARLGDVLARAALAGGNGYYGMYRAFLTYTAYLFSAL